MMGCVPEEPQSAVSQIAADALTPSSLTGNSLVISCAMIIVGPHAHFIQLAFFSVSCNNLCSFCVLKRKGGWRFVWSSRRCGQ